MLFKMCSLSFLFHRARKTAVNFSHDICAIPGLLLYLRVPWINLTVIWGSDSWRWAVLGWCSFQLPQLNLSYINEMKQWTNRQKLLLSFFTIFFFLSACITHFLYSSPKPRIRFLSSSFNYKYQHYDSLSCFVFCYPQTLNQLFFSSMLSLTSL